VVVAEVNQVNAPGQSFGGRTNYQVHRRTQSGWEVRATLPEMEAAIRAARSALDLPGTEAVRVVRDHYDPATESVRPSTVFRAVASAPVPVKPSLWLRLLSRLPTPATKATSGQRFVRRLAASLIGVVLGTAFTLMRS
jgi:hypothetical protein